MSEEYPNAGPYKDRHGRERWRFRRAGRTTALPHSPGHPEFEEAYRAIVEGRAPRKAEVKQHPSAAAPKSLKAAWKAVPKSDPNWARLKIETRDRLDRIAGKFLAQPISAGDTIKWGDVAVAELKRRHVKAILAEMSATPHAAGDVLGVIRRMIVVGLDNEWIESDPTYKLTHRPEYKGWRAWTDEERAMFEQRWAVGTTPRLAYALALWLGNRRSDVATLSPKAIRGDKIRIVQGKTGRVLSLDITPMLREVLDATDMTGPAILMTAYGEPFSPKSITGRMKDWTKAAGLPAGCTIHGLRKTLGKMLAESGATTRQIMDTLGHTDIKHAELYSREADQELLARDGMNGVVRLFNASKKPRG